MLEDLVTECREHARTKLADHFGQLRRCAALLAPDELWCRTNAHTNSVGNLLLHLAGNVHQWIVAGLGGAPLARDRAAEFARRDPVPAEELVARLEAVLRQADAVLAGLATESLARRYRIQEYDVSGLVAVMHVVEHFALHTGQVVHMTKALRDVDLSIYDEAGHKRPGHSAAP